MNAVEILTQQTQHTYSMVDKLIESVPYEQWKVTPEILETNLTWQVGHLLLSFNYHTLMCIVGFRSDVMQQMPFREYVSLFSFSTNPKEVVDKVSPEKLHNHLKIMQEASIQVISSLNEVDLTADLEPTKLTHPVAKNKYEAISWNIQHTMWHCGQIGILKRLLGERYDFGLPKERL